MLFCNHPLIILTCKHLKERARRPCHTIWEITSGVLVFVVLLLMRQVIRQHDHSLRTHVDDQRVDYVVFAPNDEVTKSFMMNVTKKLSVPSISTNQGPPIYVQGFQNEAEIQEYVKRNDTSPIAIIRFRNISEISSKLDYTIDLVNAHVSQRPKFMRLHIKETLDAQQHASLPLLKLQWAIDKTFMESLSGEHVSHKVRFPHFRAAPPQPLVPLSVIHQFLIFCTVAAPLPFFLYNSSRLVKERRTGLKELMKIVGCSPTVLRVSHLMETALLSTIYAGFITTILKATTAPILPQSDPFIIAFTITLHFLNITSMAFVTSSFSQAYEHANGLALVIYIVSCMLCNIWYNYYESALEVYLVCWFLPHAPVYLFWDEVKYLESVGEGLHFEDIIKLHDESYVPVLLTWFVFFVQQVFIMALAWYLDMVKPGKYGVAQKWDFLFKKDFWVYRKKVTFHVTVEQTRKVMRDDRFFQKGPKKPVAIKLTKVSKLYSHGFRQPEIVALDNVNLDIYKGEITVVLGIDGSGKTTLVSVVTGMTSATKGKVYVNGLDNAARLPEIRKNLGLCPQQHLTFDYLTVRENIIFFEQLRGAKREVRTTAENLIDRLYLQDKADYFSHQLSPSGERCLQVACALAGGAEVLVLDEPTSNCDSETRHNLWDVILVLRGDKTILMTTTSLEEADALGDRVALLSHGKLRCYGTPMFLKNAIGTGFNLSVTLKHKYNVALVREVIDQTLPDALTTMIDQRRVLFTLPAKDHELFPQLFDRLEERKMELGITSMGVGMSLEEMFLGFVDDDDDEDALFVKSFHAVTQLKGLSLRVQQMKVLMQRNFYNMWSVKYSFIILQIMVPVLGIIVITVTTNSSQSFHNMMDHPSWDILVKSPTVLMDLGPGRSGDLNEIRMLNPDLKILRSNNVSQDLVKLSQTDRRNDEFSKNVIGIKMEKDFSKIYFRFHSQPEATRALNVFSNIYMSMTQPYSKPITISKPGTKNVNLFIPKETILCVFWAIWVTFFITLPLTPFIAMSIRDYRASVRPTHRIVGCPNIIHWLAKLTSQMFVFLTIIPPALLLSAKFLDREETLSENGFLVALFVAQLLFLPAFLLQLYVLSFFLDEHHAVSQIYIQSIALGFSGPVIQILLKDLSEKSKVYASPVIFLTVLGSFSPVFTLSELISKFTGTARVKSFCSHNDHYCRFLIPTDSKSKLLDTMCCDPKREENGYFSGEALIEIVTLICHIIFYAIILVAVQKRWIQNFIERVANCKYKETPPNYNDLIVYHEKATVTRLMNCIKNPRGCIGERTPQTMLLVHNLHKKYTNLLHKSRRINTVKGVSFKVDAGESLVILGENGAGKSTTLLMIAGYLSATRGDCFVDGVLMNKQRSKYIDKVSLTRCVGGLDEFYTGYRNMKLLCLLHGFPREHAGAFAVNCMTYMGLQHLLHVKVGTYSAGCSRRLAVCAALLAAPRAVLLDEPMRALDPHARPLVARALASLRTTGSALLITEKSLAWRDLDALNSRVAIMSNGRIVALGRSRHIREMFANGHTARLKLKLKSMRHHAKPILIPSAIDIVDETANNVKHKRGRANSSAILNLAHRDKITESIESIKTLSSKRRLYWTKKSDEKISNEIDDNKVYRRSRNAMTTLEASSPSDDEIENEDGPQRTPSLLEKAKIDSVIPSSRRLYENLSDSDSDEDNPQAESSEAKTDQLTPELKGTRFQEQARSARIEITQAESTPEITDKSNSGRGNQSTPNLKDTRFQEQAGSSRAEITPAESTPKIRDKSNSDQGTEKEDSNTRNLYSNVSNMAESEMTLNSTLKDTNMLSPSITTMNRAYSVIDLKTDFKRQFPTSELADEHLSMLYFHIKGDSPMPYSLMFSKLEWLKRVYPDIIEDYTLSEISIEEVYGLLTKETS